MTGSSPDIENLNSLAKIARPNISRALPRERLFSLLDENGSYPLTWISGPAGSGKTTLVASYLTNRDLPCIWYQIDEGDGDIATFFYYLGLAARKASPRILRPLPLLTPEYQAGVPTFARRFFEEVCGRLKPPYVIVFDNIQDVPAASGLRKIICHGLTALPEGIRAIAMSRNEPPPSFIGMLADNKLRMVGWRDLRLNEEESADLLHLQGVEETVDKPAAWIHDKTQGWAAGLVLLAYSFGAKGPPPRGIKKLQSEKVFDYFANEFFDRLEPNRRDFLLKTSFIPLLTPGLTTELTGDNGDRILSELNRGNYFTEKMQSNEISYRYHPLFRDFLRHRAENELSPETITAIRRDAARLLEKAGQIDESIELFADAQDWQSLIPLVLKNAGGLMAQGRNASLQNWLLAIPSEIRGTFPWLLYWQGICLLLGRPSEARSHLERAYALFKKAGDRSGTFLSWSGIVDSYLNQFDRFGPLKKWIKEIKGLLRKGWEFTSPQIEIPVAISMFNALFFMKPSDPELPDWERKMKELLHRSTDPGHHFWLASYLLLYYSWTGDISKMGAIRSTMYTYADKSDFPTAAQLHWFTLDSIYLWFTAEFDLCLQSVGKALEISEEIGAHALDVRLTIQGVHGALGLGKIETARCYLDRLATGLNLMQRLDVGQYYYAKAYYHVFLGELAKAGECAAKALSLAEESGPVFPVALCASGLAQVQILQKKYDKAAIHLAQAKQAGKKMRSLAIELKTAFLQAQIDMASEHEGQAIRRLRLGFSKARRGGYWSLDWWLPQVMIPLCEKALEKDVETKYVRELIQRRRLFPAQPPYHLDSWPWPIRIETLGKFELLRDDEPLTFTGKAQKKPLELLKALVARGGHEVDDHRLADQLWPDADGDAAYRSLLTTAQRLRKLLGSAEVLRLQGGRLSLDQRLCWVDTWAFEHRYREACEAFDSDRDDEAADLLEHALELYSGPFLDQENDDHSTVSLRESLRSKFLDAVTMLCHSYEKSGAWKKAAKYYRRGLDVDEFAEEFYRGLMISYLNLGYKGRALDTYRRCRSVLASGLGIEPSNEIEKIIRCIKNGLR